MSQSVVVNQTYQATLETGTTALTGNWSAIAILTDAVCTTLTGMNGDALTAITFPKGLTIYGNFTAVTLESGKIVLYEAPR